MSELATTPGNRLVIPLSSTAGGIGHYLPRARRCGRGGRGYVDGGGPEPPAATITRNAGNYADGTVMAPLMICCLYSSSLALMSSILPPEVE